ncbi:cytochrome c oxidase subunit II [Halobiforma nitratireducens]|uniref:Cytochrome c oxidase subunit II n=1 Tax=Halobiforma nitratireducens JCM 10879 TaxID=1227454 RepID=M0LEA3_9EURY|nr:cytochrome c oxidase subunit II [Halobiforma nitratireducens]EMA31892.1 cytochrome c oxidase subunit II [Halobiforma nitratireducens JCM 10879]
MNIHTYEKLWLVAAMVLIVAFIGTITYGSVGLGIAMVGDDSDSIDPNDVLDDEEFGDPGVQQVGEDEYEVYVRAQTFAFIPGTTEPIEIPEDSEVTFHVTSPDVIHSFSVVGTNVNTMVIPGEVASMTVEFDEPGEYGLVCNEYCGSQHHEMEGLLVVTPEDEFDLTELSVTGDDEVALGDEVELTATVSNGLLEDLETTVSAEIGGEELEEDVTVPGEGETEVTFTVDADDLGEGDHDWTITVDGYEDSGQVTVVENLEDEESADGEDDNDDTEENDE